MDAADRVLDEIERAIDMLVNNPHAGHLRPDLNTHTLRFWLVRNYLIAYAAENPLLIVGILHGRRIRANGSTAVLFLVPGKASDRPQDGADLVV